MAVVKSNFGSVAAGDAYRPSGVLFNASLQGTFVGTAQIERSFDGGSTWELVTIDTSGGGAVFTGPVSFTMQEPEAGAVLYRWNVTAYTSGALAGRFGP